MKDKRILRLVLPLLHAVLSFIFMTNVFIFGNDRTVVLSKAIREVVSDKTEYVTCLCITFILGLLLIGLLWKLIFSAVDKKIGRQTLIVFSILFVLGAAVLAMVWPASFLRSEDNLVTYSYAIRFLPEYWHSLYSGCVYGAMLLVFPHPMAVSLIQWLCFVIALGYLFERISNSKNIACRLKWLVFILILIPDTMLSIVADSYRTEQYAILCMFYISLIVMDIVDRRERKPFEIILIAVLSAFIAVWRSEGAILGILGFGALILFVYKKPVKSLILYCILVVAFFLVMSLPQKIGDRKYYGNDYSFINSFLILQNILNSESANLSYDGATEDVAAIEAVCPLDYIKVFNMEGYRSYNYARGYKDINQSGATLMEGAAYKSAYLKIAMHNPKIYLRTQLALLRKATGLSEYQYYEPERTGLGIFFDIYHFEGWDIGRKDFYRLESVRRLSDSGLHKKCAEAYFSFLTGYKNLMMKTRIYAVLFFVSIFSLVFILIKDFVGYIRKKTDSLGFAAFSFIILLQYLIILMVMPGPVIAYFHACMYTNCILVLVYLLNRLFLGEKQK